MEIDKGNNDFHAELTLYIGDLDSRVDESLLYELFSQVAAVEGVRMPKDKVTDAHHGFAFVQVARESDLDYAVRVMQGVSLYGRAMRVSSRYRSSRPVDVGAQLFLGNLAPDVDETQLASVLSTFGTLLHPPRIIRDPATGASRGFAFASYTDFAASDRALAALNDQYLGSQPLRVVYAYKRDSKSGERHGSDAERYLAERLLQSKKGIVGGAGARFHQGSA